MCVQGAEIISYQHGMVRMSPWCVSGGHRVRYQGPIQSSGIYGEFRPNRHPKNNFEIAQNKHKVKNK
jgi:hypothetical protein